MDVKEDEGVSWYQGCCEEEEEGKCERQTWKKMTA